MMMSKRRKVHLNGSHRLTFFDRVILFLLQFLFFLLCWHLFLYLRCIPLYKPLSLHPRLLHIYQSISTLPTNLFPTQSTPY
jgi:hypothetical protein